MIHPITNPTVIYMILVTEVAFLGIVVFLTIKYGLIANHLLKEKAWMWIRTILPNERKTQ